MALTKRASSIDSIDEMGRSIRVVASWRRPVKGWETYDDPNKPATPRLEILDSWDLRRYTKNPVALLDHNGSMPIGWGEELQVTERGLEMRIRFAAPSDGEPEAERLWQKVKSKLVRGVSVGFEYGTRTDETIGGQPIAVFQNNVLTEVSIVALPADEDALTEEAFPDEVLAEAERKRKLSSAGRDLAGGRKTRTDAADTVQRFDYVGRLGKVQRTQVGGIKVPARLTRTGVLVYRMPDGTQRRELRHPDEVFNADSLASLNAATVTDLEHHRGLINATNWKDATLGHTENVRQDGKFVEADLVINDAETVEQIERGDLADISCGYACRLDMTSGTYEGEPYDCIQRAIRYNHVAVLPPGRGRAGRDVGLRLDSTDAVCVDEGQDHITMKTIRIDGKDYEIGTDAHIAKIEEVHRAEVARMDAKCAEVQKQKDEVQAKVDASERTAKKSAEDAKEQATKDASERKLQLRARMRLVMRAMKYVDEETDEEKMDALDTLSDRDIMLLVIKADDNDFDDKGKSDDYVRARFDMVDDEKVLRSDDPVENKVRTDTVDTVVKVANAIKREGVRNDAADPETAAKQKMIETSRNRWKQPVGYSSK